MANSRVLISENTEVFKTIDTELTKYLGALNEVVETYSALELGDVTAEVAELILSPTGGKTIETQYWTALNEQLDKSGVVNKILRDTALNGSKEPIEQFKASHRKAHSISLTYPDTAKHIVFDESSFELLSGYDENVREEYCREYLTDKAEMAFLQAVQNLHKAIAEYRVELKKVDANFFISRSLAQLDSVLKPTPNGDWVADPSRAVYFHRFAKRNQNAGPSTKRIL